MWAPSGSPTLSQASGIFSEDERVSIDHSVSNRDDLNYREDDDRRHLQDNLRLIGPRFDGEHPQTKDKTVLVESLRKKTTAQSGTTYLSPEKTAILFQRNATDVWFLPFGTVGILSFLLILFTTLGSSPDAEIRVFRGYNYTGALCDQQKHFILWPPDPRTGTIDVTAPICLDRCPSVDDVRQSVTVPYPSRVVSREVLQDGQVITHVTVTPIDVPVYATEPFAGLYCLPTKIQDLRRLTSDLGLSSKWLVTARIIRTLLLSSPGVLFTASIAAMLAVLYLFSGGKFACLTVFITTFTTPFLLFAFSTYLILVSLWPLNDTAAAANYTSLILDSVPTRPLVLFCGLVGVVCAMITALGRRAVQEQLKYATALRETVAEVLTAQPFILAFPIIGATLITILWLGGIMVLAGIFTSPDTRPHPHLISPSFDSTVVSKLPSLGLLGFNVADNRFFLKSDSFSNGPDFHSNIFSPGTMIGESKIGRIGFGISIHNSSHVTKDDSTKLIASDRYRSSKSNFFLEPYSAMDIRVNKEHVSPDNLYFVSDTSFSGYPADPGEIHLLQRRLAAQLWYNKKTGNQEKLDYRNTEAVTVGIIQQFAVSRKAVVISFIWLMLLLWLVEMIRSFVCLSIAITTSLWYFTMPDALGYRPTNVDLVKQITAMVACCHMGTLMLCAVGVAAGQVVCFVGWTVRSRIIVRILRARYCVAAITLRFAERVFRKVEILGQQFCKAGLVDCALHSNDFIPSCRTAQRVLFAHEQIASVHALSQLTSHLSLNKILSVALVISSSLYLGITRITIFANPGSAWYIENPVAITIIITFCVGLTTRVILSTDETMSLALLYCFATEAKNRCGIVVFAPEKLRELIEESESELHIEQLQQESVRELEVTSPPLLHEEFRIMP